MFSYRHHYHAGNYADVLKHVVLVALLQALARKAKPFCYLDTHAAIGRYDLTDAIARKTGEFREGIGRLWTADGPPALVETYLAIVRGTNPDGQLKVYPGSPRIARGLLREQDSMLLCELNKVDHTILKHEFNGDHQVAVHLQDAWQALKAFLPPKERRGLVLIDPAYEQKSEYQRLVAGLEQAYQRWPTGTYAIWYPLMAKAQVQGLHRAIEATGITKILRAELSVAPLQNMPHMCGSGMLVVNPPWQLDEELAAVMPWLAGQLQQHAGGGWRVDWLVPEK